jgi:hypothetical protein
VTATFECRSIRWITLSCTPKLSEGWSLNLDERRASARLTRQPEPCTLAPQSGKRGRFNLSAKCGITGTGALLRSVLGSAT